MGEDFSCWENETTGLRTEIPLQSSGDLGVYQTRLIGFESVGRVVAHYDYRSTFLMHLMLFHLQNGMPIPNRHDWNEKFFDGNFPVEERGTIFDLFRIRRHAEVGKLIKIVTETEFNEDEDITPIPQSFDREIKSYPIIDRDGNLVYLQMPKRKREILLTRDDVTHAFEVVREHMLDDARGQRSELGKIYSRFPFEAYEREEADSR